MNSKIIKAAKEWIDTPFHEQGRLKNIGCDCIGLILGIASDLNLKSKSGIPFKDHNVVKQHCFDDYNKMVVLFKDLLWPINELSVGSICIVRIKSFQYHICLISNIFPKVTIIHSCAKIGKVTEHRMYHEWYNNIVLKGSLQASL